MNGNLKMKLLAISDIEVPLLYSPMIVERFRDVDLILSCGDLSYYYIEFIVTMLNVPCYFVRGNHASFKEYSASGERKYPWGAVDLHHKSRQDESGLLLAGLEGSLRYNMGAYQYTQAEYWGLILSLAPRLLLNKMKHDRYLDVFVAHAPPWQVHDENDLPHTGIKAFRWLIKVFQPTYFLHGHIHVYRNDTVTRSIIDNTTVQNVYGYQTLSIPAPQAGTRQKKR